MDYGGTRTASQNGDQDEYDEPQGDGSSHYGRPLTIAEMVSEFVRAERTIAEIAGLNVYQVHWIYCRPRNKNGDLIREWDKLPQGVHVDQDGMRIIGNPCSYETAYYKARKCHGISKPQSQEQWKSFLDKNPRFGKGGIDAQSE